ncbi:MAG: IS1595 family transposase [Flavisolibacter sp.]
MPMARDISDQDFENMFSNEEEALRSLFDAKTDGSSCPRCRMQTKYYRVRGRRCFECGVCAYQIYPCKGTPMENSKLPVRTWLRAIHLTLQEPIGLSSTKLAARLGVTYKVAWNMNFKLRDLMNDPHQNKLRHIVEIDETYCGGKKKAPAGVKKIGYTGRENKIEIIGMRQKSGELRTFYVGTPTKRKINKLILDNIKIGSTIYTDESGLYSDLTKLGYKHSTVNHSKFQWSKGWTTTNRIEGTWSKLKRGWRGVYVHLGAKHIESYLQEFNFKRTHCKMARSKKFELLKNRLFSSVDNHVSNSVVALAGYAHPPQV